MPHIVEMYTLVVELLIIRDNVTVFGVYWSLGQQQEPRRNIVLVGWVNQLVRHSFSMILLGILVVALIAISEWSIDPVAEPKTRNCSVNSQRYKFRSIP